jgi:hypothetical protein
MKGLSWVTLILGLWVVVSPYVGLTANILNISNVIAGILVILIACVDLFGKKTGPQI